MYVHQYPKYSRSSLYLFPFKIYAQLHDNIKIDVSFSRLLRYKSHLLPQNRLKMDGFMKNKIN